MNYAEVEFFLAEAVERGFIATGSAESHYNAGITASMTYWGASATDAAAYLANPKVAYGSVAGTWQQKIGFQKWIALYMQGIEAWAEWRRLDFGVLQLPVAGALPTARIDPNKLPTRLTYPLDEVTLNGTNTAAAVAAQGPDRLDTKLWWDVN